MKVNPADERTLLSATVKA